MLRLVNVSKYYNTNNVVALGLRKANLELGINEFVAVVGESGSGKTTLLNVISGIDSYEEGEMYINDEETSYFSTADLENYRKKYIAFVFQNYNLVDSYTVLQNVELPLLLAGYSQKDAKRRAMDIIQQVGMEKHIHHKATKLSGGQKQRVVIARALAKDCPIIAADEPTGNLDSESAKQIIKLLHDIAKDKLVIVVTHDFDQVKEYASRKIRIYDGEIVEDVEVQKIEKLDLPVFAEEEKKIKVLEHIRMAFKNLLAVPKKTILMILVFFVFSFFVALVYGAFNLAMSMGSNYDIYYTTEEYFGNKSISRIVMNKADKSAFTAAELLDIASKDQVKTVISKDFLLDVRVEMRSTQRIESLDEFYYLGSVRYLPVSVINNQSLILSGVMPSAEGEALLALSTTLMNNVEVDDVFLNQTYYQSGARDFNIYSSVEHEIVGIVDSGDLFMDNDYSYMIISDEEFAELTNLYYTAFVKAVTLDLTYADDTKFGNESFLRELLIYNGMQIAVDNTLTDHQLGFPTEYELYFCETGGELDCEGLTAELFFQDAYTENTFSDLEAIFKDYSNELCVNQNIYDQIYYDDIYQVSVLTDSNINVQRLISNLERIKDGSVEKYKVIYPYAFEFEDPYGSALRFFESLGLLAALLATIIGSTFLSYIIFRVIINTKLRDYAIFRTVGANQMVIRLLIYLENVFVVVFSFVLFLGLSILLKNMDAINQYNILYGLKTFAFGDYLIFFGILLLMSLIISGRYCGRVFQDTVQTSLKAE